MILPISNTIDYTYYIHYTLYAIYYILSIIHPALMKVQCKRIKSLLLESLTVRFTRNGVKNVIHKKNTTNHVSKKPKNG